MAPTPPRRRRAASLALATLLALGAVPACSSSPQPYWVSPDGDDAQSGRAPDQALASIQRALELAMPGDEVRLAPGDYFEDFETVRAGRPGEPIRIVGARGHLPTARASVILGAGRSHIVDLRHDHIVLADLVIDGLAGTASQQEGYRSKLVYAKGPEDGSGITGLRLLRLELRNAGTECVRLKYFAHHNEIADSIFENCGVWDFRFSRGKKNGEAIYIGTAPEQLPRDFVAERDESDDNWVHQNWFRTNGNECIDIKEGSSRNLVEHNECTGQLDPDSGGISARGSDNRFRENRVFGNLGVGIRLGGDTPDDALRNEVTRNVLSDNRAGALKVMVLPQAEICGNEIDARGAPVVRGPGAKTIQPAAGC